MMAARLLKRGPLPQVILSSTAKRALHTAEFISSELSLNKEGVSSLCNFLCLQAGIEMPTCAMACFDLDIDKWDDLYKDCATLCWYDYPKNL